MTRHVPAEYSYDEIPKTNAVKVDNFSDNTFVCNICGLNFCRKASLKLHLNTHNDKNGTSRQNVCNICYKKFTAKKNLLKHLRDVHKNFKEAERMVIKKLKCPEKNCEFLCRMMKDLRDHIEKCHDIKILKDTLEFPTETAFQKWKTEEETNTVSWFVTGRKKSALINGTKKQTLYCHRTGHYNPRGFGKYRMRSVGSCKMGMTCPATMEVTEYENGHVAVIYYKTHFGHMQDLAYMKLTRDERAYLAEKIEQGFSLDAILEDVKDGVDINDEKRKRIHLLSKKDLYSIMKTEKLKKEKRMTEGDEGNKTETSLPSTASEIVQEEALLLGNLEMGKIDESIQQSFGLYPAHSTIIPQEPIVHPLEHQLIESQPKQIRDMNLPQSSGEGVTSQIVILSPDMNGTSVAEIILLSAGEAASQSTFLTQNKIPPTENFPNPKLEEEALRERNKANKSILCSQLKEKLDRIFKFLPKAEFLTPKQFDLINAKMDGILDIFNVASVKSEAWKQKTKKKACKRNKTPEGWAKIDKGIQNIMDERVLAGQQIYESPLVYEIYD